MSGFNKFSVYREFPFLTGCCHIADLNDARVERFDKEALLLKHIRDGSEEHAYPKYAKIFLLTKDGGRIAQVGRQMPGILFRPWSWGLGLDNSATTADLLHLLGDRVSRVHYVVDVYKDLLILYKPPKEFESIGSWLLSCADDARSQDL